MAQCGHCLVPLPSLVYYAGQLRFGGFSFDCHKVGPEQKNIFFPPLCRPRLQYKGHRLPFPTPWDANITFFRAGFWVHGLGPRIIWVWLGYCYRNLNSPWGFTVVKKWLFVRQTLWSLAPNIVWTFIRLCPRSAFKSAAHLRK